jgi:D-alanyl-D-alanine carboxypeptidase/D-alanyl-D-alanine-endopeptidase (penicillin-binding protein 4)
MRARTLAVGLVATLAATTLLWLTSGARAAAAPPKWVQRIDQVVGDLPVAVAIGEDGAWMYRHRAWKEQAPASNEKLLLSMALFDRLAAGTTIPTRALAAGPIADGVVDGPLWIVGRGDPEGGPDDMKALADAIVSAGVRKIAGRVLGAPGPFARDWWADGWKSYFPTYYIALPTALTFDRNVGPTGRHITDPERRAAIALTRALESRGVLVTGKPGLGPVKGKLRRVAEIRSDPLAALVRRMNVRSVNFSAEVLGKFLGARTRGRGTIAAGAAAIRRFAARHDVRLETNDGSGLSYANRVSPEDIVRLLWVSTRHRWGETLRLSLAKGGQGTLEGRLTDVAVRAKTGTLDSISALSGWVWLERAGTWAEFSILSRAMPKERSVRIENAIVRVVSANAAPH